MKKILFSLLIIVVATLATYNMYISRNNVKLSDLALSNMEALADDNEWGSRWCYYNPLTVMCVPWGYGVACYCDI
ncbi:hypothetical protein GAN98_06400 [Bacteroides thetaiotaomicron]|uniref:NVEALA protein n=1 Tax=Bacteroides thetaiotaomicron TaxID=818 RepID=A0A6I0SFE3_BACT4|nr:NVEALA domain-containing protein [Bacteroides sp. AR20]KAB4464790.1 hypothetical protein GAN98_06400 [Bacteroides thetaiotaomicron]KAB4465341.1 hypothetical protein GAN67_09580 [Bacteroides thetaiotaomicron]KAB4474973.1 hypothetical protein GAN76_08260 [Bacteroides thetaiotaomicron]KAB4478003.1 hypothetical protein GAN59_03580 [Bacteroides thetaiotaomicron]KAB4487460.1 hypothetical protein GAN57_06420 [Bacteroides thetaiotaomicron]